MNDQSTTPSTCNADSSDAARRNLLETARSIDWLAPLRDHPFATVGVSAALGAAMASNPKSVAMTARFASAMIPFIQKATLMALRRRAESRTEVSHAEITP